MKKLSSKEEDHISDKLSRRKFVLLIFSITVLAILSVFSIYLLMVSDGNNSFTVVAMFICGFAVSSLLKTLVFIVRNYTTTDEAS